MTMKTIVRVCLDQTDDEGLAPWAIYGGEDEASVLVTMAPLAEGMVEAHDEVQDWVEKLDGELMGHGWQRIAEPKFVYWRVFARVRKVGTDSD